MKTYPFIICTFLLLAGTVSAQQNHDADVGKTDFSTLSQNNEWFRDGFSKYQPNKNQLEKLNNKLEGYEFLVFAAGWCPDTRNLLPKFFKVLKEADISEDRVEVYLLDYSKQSPENLEEQYKIISVPTFILLKDGKEQGRIVEKVNGSLEKELLQLLK